MKSVFATPIFLIAFMTLFVSSASAHNDATANAAKGSANHGPIGVMGDHVHKVGEWMMSYRYMRMEMEDNLDGDDERSAREVVGTMANPGEFPVAPERMTMEMHMLGAMYAQTHRLTWMIMVPYIELEMDHLVRNGVEFTTEASGIGDTSVQGLYEFWASHNGNHRLHFGLGMSIPTGSIDERDDTPAMNNAQLPYNMQIGSGTYDALGSITYRGFAEQLSWGMQLSGVARIGENDENYQLGNRFAATSWVAWSVNDMVSTSFRLNGMSWGAIEGQRADLNPNMIQTANINNQEGDRIDAAIGLNVHLHSGHRFALEYAEPVYQYLEGPQMQTKNIVTIGWQYAPH